MGDQRVRLTEVRYLVWCLDIRIAVRSGQGCRGRFIPLRCALLNKCYTSAKLEGGFYMLHRHRHIQATV